MSDVMSWAYTARAISMVTKLYSRLTAFASIYLDPSGPRGIRRKTRRDFEFEMSQARLNNMNISCE